MYFGRPAELFQLRAEWALTQQRIVSGFTWQSLTRYSQLLNLKLQVNGGVFIWFWCPSLQAHAPLQAWQLLGVYFSHIPWQQLQGTENAAVKQKCCNTLWRRVPFQWPLLMFPDGKGLCFGIFPFILDRHSTGWRSSCCRLLFSLSLSVRFPKSLPQMLFPLLVLQTPFPTCNSDKNNAEYCLQVAEAVLLEALLWVNHQI